MSLPSWISEKLEQERRVNTKLTQQHVVEAMYNADRPFFSIQQVKQRIKPDVSKVTVRNRLNELGELGIVATETYPDSLTLYYINHPESDWPLSPEGKQAIEQDSAETQRPLLEFLQRPQIRQILREELWRSIAWIALGLFGWAILVSFSDRLAVNVWTGIGVPVFTWASLTVGMIGLRLTTGNKLQVLTKEGLHIVTLGGALFGGFWVVFLILVLEWSPLLTIGLYLFVTLVYFVCYFRIVLPKVNLSVKN